MKTTGKPIAFLIVGLLLMGAQSCTHDDREFVDIVQENENQIAYDAADVIVGSMLYNDFTLTPGFDGPNDPSVDIANITGFKDFYRCKQCHAWDQKAKFASYINRAPRVNRPDVSGAQLTNLKFADISILFDKIKNTGGGAVDPARTADGTNPALGGNDHPDYGTILTDAQIWDLVKFLREGALDTDELYAITTVGSYPTGSRTYSDLGRNGNAAAGDVFYTSKCASCHGADGSNIPLGGNTLGKFTRDNPHEVQHKIVSGQLGSSMGPTPATLEDMKNFYKAINDTIKYPN
ncbi:c-type cytochrome [Arenibacter sp. GZD96]|uniref:c-type cytochrome n=1 Tax=Aurantibrevibacter litoralis TaxID=3106030 RepID=UPI002AFFE76C|nr:c-type cytochrome [Arenibacter sp. GZD-96]MEA1786550.1 c-type cytochrome [Arenibacter sp. GZD-96]